MRRLPNHIRLGPIVSIDDDDDDAADIVMR